MTRDIVKRLAARIEAAEREAERERAIRVKLRAWAKAQPRDYSYLLAHLDTLEGEAAP